MSTNTNALYEVVINTSAEKRYIKKLKKRHKNAWSITQKALISVIERFEASILTSRVEVLNAVEDHRLVKVYFTIAGSRKSAKASGHRCIVYLDEEAHKAQILLVYSKNEIGSPNETAKVRQQIKVDHPQIAKWLRLK